MITPIRGTPGVRAIVPVEPRNIFFGNWEWYLPGGKLISSLSRDWGNTGYTNVLRAGLLMGKITTGGKYAPSILGVSQNAYTSGGTSITVTAAQAVVIAARIGTSGNLNYVGPPTANGTNAVLGPIAFSAINTTTGVITTSTLGANLIAGGFVVPTDGSQLPLTLIPPGAGVNVFDYNGSALDVPYEHLPIGGTIQSDQIIAWPSDTSLQAWIAGQLSQASGGKFTFTHTY